VSHANGELSRPGHTAEQVVEAKFFRKPRAFEKPLAPRVGCSVLLNEAARAAENPNVVYTLNRGDHRKIPEFQQLKEYTMNVSEVNRFNELYNAI
jgi:hypothetical protein